MDRLMRKEKGQGLVEYALVLVLVAVVAIGILTVLGPQIGNVFSQITNSLGGNVATTSNGGGSSATVVNATAVTDGSGAVVVTVTLSEDATVTVRDQATGNENTGACNTPCQMQLTGLGPSGTIDVIAPANSITVSYSN